MISLKVLGSGSTGNCYLLSTENETLVLDAGVSSKEAKIALDFDVSRIVGVLVTHAHMDHLKYASEYEKLGIPVFKPYENTEQKIIRKHFGSFTVTTFDLPHDGTENRGFIINVDGQTISYMTDFEYCRYVFAPQVEINHMIIEANYCKDFISTDAVNREHVFKGHAELQTTLGFISANKTNSLETVLLCHLSAGNADKRYFIEETKKVARIGVYVAEKGLEINLSDTPF